MIEGGSDSTFAAYLLEVKKNTKRVLSDQFHQFECLKAAVANESICRPVLGKHLVHIMDQNNQMIGFVCADVLQRIFPAGTVEKMKETFDRWSFYQALPKPDHRHPLHQADFLPRHPQFDVERASDGDSAKAYVEHYGIYAPFEHADGNNITMTGGHHMDRHMRNNFTRRIYSKLQRGGFRISTEAINFFFKELCPDDFVEYADICRVMDQDQFFHTGAEVETFALHALLGNVATQDHIDSSDAPYGVAGIVTFGDFEGDFCHSLEEKMLMSFLGDDILLWQLGLRLSLASGSVCMLRGHELRHATTDWDGKSRSCIVAAMPAGCKRAAALQRDQAADLQSESEQSCPGRDAVLSSQEEEEIEVSSLPFARRRRKRKSHQDAPQGKKRSV